MPEDQNDDQNQGHPAWQELLNDVPEDLHPLLKERLEDWDKRQQDKLAEVRNQYEGFDAYQPLIENDVPLEAIQKSLWLAQQLEENPQSIVEQAIKAFDLGYVPKTELEKLQQNNNNSNYDDDDDYDFGEPKPKQQSQFNLEDHPAFKEMQKKAQQYEEYLNSQRQQEEEREAMTALEQELQQLHEQHDSEDGTPGFDDLYVTALISQGIEPEQAIELYNSTVNERAKLLAGIQQNNEPNPPVIMGGDGSTGSGVGQQPVDMGKMSNNDLDDLVRQIIEQDRNA